MAQRDASYPARRLRPVEETAESEWKRRAVSALGRGLTWLLVEGRKRTLEAGVMKVAAVKSPLPMGRH